MFWLANNKVLAHMPNMWKRLHFRLTKILLLPELWPTFHLLKCYTIWCKKTCCTWKAHNTNNILKKSQTFTTSDRLSFFILLNSELLTLILDTSNLKLHRKGTIVLITIYLNKIACGKEIHLVRTIKINIKKRLVFKWFNHQVNC